MQFDKDFFITRQDRDGNYSYHSVKAAFVEIEGYENFKFFAFEDTLDRHEVVSIFNISEYHTGMQIITHPILKYAIEEAKKLLDTVGIDGFAKMIAKKLNQMAKPANV